MERVPPCISATLHPISVNSPRVRALKLRIVEAFFDRWDFDGIELDWMRR